MALATRSLGGHLRTMITYLIRRIVHGLIVVLGVSLIVFFVMRVIGDPVRHMLPLEHTPEQYQTLKHQLGFDRSIPVQFFDFLGDLARLDFGESLWQRGLPARDLVFARLPATLSLVSAGMLLAVILALPLGIIAALKPGSVVDRLTVTLSLIGLSLPQFWLGALLVLVFSVHLGVLPSFGRGGLEHLVLPTIAIGLPAAGRITQMVRSSMIDQLNEPYVTTARAKGMSFPFILVRHTLRNALVPVVTLIGWETMRAFAGYTVVVETVFAWPGIGLLAIQAIQHQDIILLQATVFTSAILVVLMTIIVDLSYSWIDPRIKAT